MPTAPLTVAAVAARLALGRSTVRDLCARGEITAHRFGRAWRVYEHDLAMYINRSRHVPASAASPPTRRNTGWEQWWDAERGRVR